ncbi:hypothetical protein [Actinoplanes teichomyceticus]|uniref:Alkylhydroperoxidase family enzyme n=1 Tax=Actinoplanes teichomyceticus TaxID=1867 RepID=A0A561VSS6_ACTTI|nr:hypothetical protein [Actinoplanes teichomyceticus]TWG14648.1 hypothetical protein FHX34_104954 [Actinoplanes teichomyceticus]
MRSPPRAAARNASTISRCRRTSAAPAGEPPCTRRRARLADRPDPVPDAVWDEATKHYCEKQLAAIVLWIATSNLFNRINVTTRQQAPQHWG